MDTSGTYIRMCEKAEKIQDRWHPAWGDLWYRPPHAREPEHGEMGLCVEMKANYFFPKTIWLPRQDQLQEMVADKYSLMEYVTFFWEALCDGKLLGDTMEQLWLAFVMKEKHNKVWEGSDWK